MTRKLEHAKTRWAHAAVTVALALALGTLLAVALPQQASAGDDFERGFKRELGAIAAHEVVGLGRHIIVSAVTGHHGVRHRGHHGHNVYQNEYRRPYRYSSLAGNRSDYRPYPRYRSHRYGYTRPWQRHARRDHHDPHGSCDH